MSFVSVIVCDNYLSVVADSRTTAIYENNILGEIVSENHKKIIEMSKNAFLCSTGKLEDAESFIAKSELAHHVLENGKIKNETMIRHWYESVRNYITTDYFFEVKFGGLTVDNTFQVYTISSNEFDIFKLNKKSGKLFYSFAHSSNIEKNYPIMLFAQHYNSLRVETPDSVRKIQDLVNDQIADQDPTVNKNKSYFRLVR